jgi:Ca2+-binding RTX toxin-like protein
VGGLSSGNVIHDNSISGNAQGIVNSATAPVDAVDNWWGTASGPAGWGTGSGDTTGSNVDFFPWYTNAAMTTSRACDQTLASPGTLYGTGGNDVMCGSPGDDLMYGKGGKDLMLGRGGHDHLYGRAGDDALIGGVANDDLHGNTGFDSLQGRAGTDKCYTGGGGGQTQSC